MTGGHSSEFKHKAFEADIGRLETEIQNLREKPEFRGVGDHEVMKEAIKTITPSSQNSFQEGSGGGGSADQVGFEPVPEEIKLEVENLVNLAFSEGIQKAIKKADKSSAFVIDTFHDILAGRLREEFKKRGLAI